MLLKKNHRVDRFTILNYCHNHEHAHRVLVKNGGCITSHNNLNTRGEQAFYTKYTGK